MKFFEDFVEGKVEGYFYAYRGAARHLEAIVWAEERNMKINVHSPLVFYDSIYIPTEAMRVEFKLTFL